MTTITPFDTAEYLDNDEVIAEYLAASLEEGTDVFLEALATVARARGMTQLARDCGLGREILYKALSPGSKPRFDTIIKITKALGVPLAPSSHPAESLIA